MSRNTETVVDSRVVELTLNNASFERNATQSISTITKLKDALDFSDAGKGLDKIHDGVAKINVNILTEGVRTLKDEFSALDVIGVTTLTRLTDKVESAAEQFVKGFTVQPISSGWDKFAEKTTAVQTIMASTATAFEDVGEQTEYVYKQLDKLNWFTDETSYSFTDMVSNIGKFTSNSVELGTAVTAMQGIANWAAISGQNASEAGRAMYNLAQAISLGYVQLIDWKSIQNANMATTEFKQTALETAEALGTLELQADGTYKTLAGHAVDVNNFTDNLKDQWFTSDVLLQTLENYGGFTDKLYALYNKTGLMTSELLDYLEEYATNSEIINEVAAKSHLSVAELKKDFDELSSATYDLGKRSFRAGQEAKTFAEALDATKEAAGSAWSNLFETIFGDYEHAKVLWTGLAETLYTIFVDPINNLNDVLKQALSITSTTLTREDWGKIEEKGLASAGFRRKILLNAKKHGIAIDGMIDDEETFLRAIDEGKLTIELAQEALDRMDASASNVGKTLPYTLETVKTKATDLLENGYSTDLEDRLKELGGSLEGDAIRDYVEIWKDVTNGTFETTDAIMAEVDALWEEKHAVEEATKSSKDLESVRNEALRVLRNSESGYSTNMKERFEQLEANGFDAQMVQDYVNAWNKASNGTWDLSEATMAAADALWLEKYGIDEVTESGINLYELTGKAALTGFALEQSGLMDLLAAAENVAATIGEAFTDVFFPKAKDQGLLGNIISTAEEVGGLPVKIFKMVQKFKDFTAWLRESTEDSEALRDVFRGIFSVVDFLVQGFITIHKLKFKGILSFFRGLQPPVAKTGQSIGDLIFKFHSFIQENDIFGRIVEKVSDLCYDAGVAVRTLIDGFLGLPAVQDAIGAFSDVFDYASDKFLGFLGISTEGTEEAEKDSKGLFGSIGDSLGNLSKKLFHSGKDVEDFAATAKEGLHASIELEPNEFTQSADVVEESIFSLLIRAIGSVFNAVGAVLHSVFTWVGDQVANAWKVIVDTLSAQWPLIKEELSDWFDNLPAQFSGFGTTVAEFFSGVWDNITSTLTNVWDNVAAAAAAAWPIVKAGFEMLWASIKSWFLSAQGLDLSFLDGVFSTLWKGIGAIPGVIRGTFSAITTLFSGLTAVLGAAWTSFKNFLNGLSKSKAAKGTVTTISKFFTSAFNKISFVLNTARKAIVFFLKQLDKLGGFSWDNFVTAFNKTKDVVFDYLSHKVPGFDTFRDQITSIIETIRNKLSALGLDSEGLKSKWNAVSSFFTTTFKTVYEGAKTYGGKIVTAVSNWFNNPTVRVNFTRFKGAFASLWHSLGPFWDSLKGAFSGFLEEVNNLGGFKWNNLGNIWEAFKNSIGGVFSNFTGFDQLKFAIKKLWEDIKEWLKEHGIDLDMFDEQFTNFKDSIVAAFDEANLPKWFADFIHVLFGDMEDEGAPLFQRLETFVNNVAGAITTATQGFSVSDALVNFLSLVINVADEVAEAGEETEKAGTFKDDIIKFMKDLNEVIKASPTGKLIGWYSLISILNTIGNFSSAAKTAAKTTKGLKTDSIFEQITKLVVAIGGVISVVALQANFGNAEKFTSTLTAVGTFVTAIAGVITAASVLIEKFGTGGSTFTLLSGNSFTNQMSGVQLLLESLFTKLLDRAFITGVIIAGADALAKVAETGADGDTLLKGAEAISMIAGVAAIIMEGIGVAGKFGIGAAEAQVGLSAISQIFIEGGLFLTLLGAVDALLNEINRQFGGSEDTNLIKETLLQGLDVVGAIGEKIGEVVGRVAGGFAGGFDAAKAQSLGEVGEGIVKYIEAVQPLGDGKHEINSSAINKVLTSIGRVSWTGFGIGIRDFLMPNSAIGQLRGENTITKVTDAMSEIATAVATWQSDLQSIESITLPDGLGALAEQIKTISAAGLSTAINNWWTDLLFKSDDPNVKSVTSTMVFSEAVGDIKKIVTDWNETFPDGGDLKFNQEGWNALVQSVKDIPDLSFMDVVSKFLGGETDVAQFAADMGALGAGIKGFADATGGTVITDNLMRSAETIKILAQAAAIMGDESLSKYYQPFVDLLTGGKDANGNDRSSLADAFNNFASSLSLSEAEYNKAAEVSDTARKLGFFARGLAALVINDSDIADLTVVTRFCNNIRSIVDAITYTASGDYSSADAFATAIEKIANAGLAETSKVLKEKEKEATKLIPQYNDWDTNINVSTTVDTKEVEQEGIVASDAFTNAAKQMVAALASVFISDESKASVNEALTALVNAAIDHLNGQIGNFSSAASNLVAGFTNTLGAFHIRLAVSAAAYHIGRVAVESLNKALDERSPSRESAKSANYFVAGFTNAIDDHVDDVYRGSYGMGQAAVRGLRGSVRAINAMLSEGLNTQPVIRPVLDLSNVQNGTATLNGMLALGGPVGIGSNIAAINANVNARNITTNADILGAITELGSALSRPSNSTTYNVNGITYDDGSNVTEAVRSLIHAAKIERRV